MSKNWLDQRYKPVRTNVLFEREESLIPDTMKDVETEIQARNLEAEEKEMNQMIQKLYQEVREIERQKGVNRGIINDLRGGKVKSNNKYKYNIRCPECPGFVNKEYICETCDIKICKHCQDIIPKDIKLLKSEQQTDETNEQTIERLGLNESLIDQTTGAEYHCCDEEKVATIAMMKRETKPCPKCGTPIFKIEGCDQMWDPQCGTAFSWRTGEIVTGVIHNPHYFEYMREHGNLPRQPGDVPCGGNITMHNVNHILTWIPKNRLFDQYIRSREYKRVGEKLLEQNGVMENIQKRYDLIRLCRILSHIEHIEMPRYTTTWDHDTNRNLRVKYIMKELPKEDFTQYLFTREKNFERSTELLQIFRVFFDVCQDVCRRLEEKYNQRQKQDFESIDKFMKLIVNDESIHQTWWVESIEDDQQPIIDGYYCITSNGEYRYKRILQIKVLKPEIYNKFWDEISSIEKYCNEQFKNVAKTYKLSTPLIDIREDMVYQKGSKVR